MQKYRQKAATTRNDDRHKQKVDADWEAKEETKLHQVRQNAAKRLAFLLLLLLFLLYFTMLFVARQAQLLLLLSVVVVTVFVVAVVLHYKRVGSGNASLSPSHWADNSVRSVKCIFI